VLCYKVSYFASPRRLIFSPEGSFFRSSLLDEVVKSMDELKSPDVSPNPMSPKCVTLCNAPQVHILARGQLLQDFPAG
jgi:hypothetical protein